MQVPPVNKVILWRAKCEMNSTRTICTIGNLVLRLRQRVYLPNFNEPKGALVGILDQLTFLGQSYVWVPGLVFALVVGGIYFLSRPGMAAELTVDAPAKNSEKPKEQRETFRRHGNPVEVHVAKPDDKTNPLIGSVLDRSMGGMRLAVFYEIEIGTVISIRPLRVDDMVPWVELEVRSCRPSVEMPGHFEVGCQYVKSPPYSIQLLFK